MKRYERYLWSALVVIALARLFTLGAYPLIDPTEGRYAEIAREMVTTGDWVTPKTHQGQPFLGKPPLSFWLTAISYKALGINEFAARLPSFLLIVLMGWLTFILAQSIRVRFTGLLSAIVFATTGLVFVIAAGVMTDPSLGATVTLCMVSFSMSFKSQTKSKRLMWGYLFFAALGFCVLAKGLVGWVLLLCPIAIWTLCTGNTKAVFSKLPWATGGLLTLIIAVPWHLLAEKRTPGFLEYYFVGEHFKRFLVSEWKGDKYGTPHDLPRGTIILLGFVAAMPWTIVLFSACRYLWQKGRRLSEVLQDEWSLYLLIWMVWPLFFFSLSSNIMITYVLPALPAFAILTALALGAISKIGMQTGKPWFIRKKCVTTLVLMIPLSVTIGAVTIMPCVGDSKSQKDIIEKFNELSLNMDAELIYTDEMPHSADFYSRGNVEDIPDESTEAIRLELQDKDLDFYAIKDNDLDSFPPEGLELTLEIGRFGEYILRREKEILSE